MSSFGVRLKAIRTEQGLRQKDLATTLELAQTTIANYEQGTRFPDESTLRGIADTLGVSLDFLMGRVSSTRTPVNRKELIHQPVVALTDPAREYMDHVLQGRSARAQDLLDGIKTTGVTIAELYLHVLQPALWEVGRLWELGELDVSREHLFSEATERIMAGLLSTVPFSDNGPVFVGFAVAPEPHKIGIRMVADLLMLDGWRTVFLGANLPTPSILQALQDHKAQVVGISASMPYHVNPVATLVRVIRDAKLPMSPRIMVGGLAFNRASDLWEQIGADGYAIDAGDAVRVARSLIGNSRPR